MKLTREEASAKATDVIAVLLGLSAASSTLQSQLYYANMATEAMEVRKYINECTTL